MLKPVNDNVLRLLGPIVLYAFVGFFFRLDWYLTLPPQTLLKNDLIALTAGLICWQIARWVVLRVQARWPGFDNTPRRILLLLLLLPLLANFAWLLRHSARYLIDGQFLYFKTAVELGRTLGIQLFYHFIYYVIYEGGYILREWQRTYIQKEELEKSNLQTRLSSLQHQVSPHFLFNSLNSVSSLISENPQQAEEFVEELSSVYRYLLRANEESLTPLATELEFIQSYYHLLQTRHGDALKLILNIEPAYTAYQIPPLTLQLLVENAVKHNIILPEQPLVIQITTDKKAQLTVSNNLQRKNVQVFSHGIGLANILKKYRVMGQQEPTVQERNDRFEVILPLVEN
ncbi:sensor histidine kinase [Tellurirhabdus rosea]|uniref:sensor histidine kinase n=1 Tax=Tellurirhabdus rosea TaxID=2674997 RepID=UPI002250D0A2|nr:histidine kinase [Tellurirhabdus rosea]